MGHTEVFKKFKVYFPSYANQSEVWFPCGRNAVRIRLKSKFELVFTYKNDQNWSLETINVFIDRTMKGEQK